MGKKIKLISRKNCTGGNTTKRGQNTWAMHHCDGHHSRVDFGDQLDVGCRSKLFDHVPILHGHLQLVNCFRLTTSKNSTEWPLRLLFPSHHIDSKTLVFSVSKKLECRALETPVGRSTCAETELRSQDTVGSRHFRQNFVEPPFRMAFCCKLGFDSKKMRLQCSCLWRESLTVYRSGSVTIDVVKSSPA